LASARPHTAIIAAESRILAIVVLLSMLRGARDVVGG
jgi:hypothetical protein